MAVPIESSVVHLLGLDASAAASAAPSASELHPCRRRYTAEASTTTPTSGDRMTKKPMISNEVCRVRRASGG